MSFGVEYIINLIDRFSPIAEKVAKSAADADRALNKLGGDAGAIDGKIAKSAEAMNKLAAANEKAGRAVSDFTRMNSRAAQDRARANELEIASLNRVEKLQTQMLERHQARQQLIASGQLPAPGGRGDRVLGRLGFGAGLMAAGMVGDNAVMKENLSYDEQLRLLRGVLMTNDPAKIGKLQDAAANLSRGGVFSQSEIVGAFHDLATKGVSADDMPMMTRKVLGIATGAGEDLKSTLNTHLDIVRMYNLALDKLPHISDTIATAQMRAGASLSNAREFFKYAGPAAAIGGVSFEDTTAIEEALALKGVKGSLAGTGFSMMMTHLNSWSKKQAGIYQRLHLSKSDIIDPVTHKMRPILDVLDKLAAATSPDKLKPGETQFGIFSDLFGARAARTVSSLVQSLDTLHALRGELDHTTDTAEKMGRQGLLGLSAATKQLTASWNSLDLAIGRSGFNEKMESIVRKIGGALDWLAGTHSAHGRGKDFNHPWLLQLAGAAAIAGDALSKLALPLMAIQMLGGFSALGGLIRGAAWLTGLSQLKNLGSALAMFGAGSASGVLRFSSGVGALIARSAGLAGLATNLGLVAGSARLLMGMTGIGTALLIGAEVVQHWDQIAAAISRAAAALKELAKGNTAPIKEIGSDIAKRVGIDTPKSPDLQRPHGSRFYQPPSPADRLSAATRVQADVNLKTTIEPIVVHIPPSIRLEGTLTGANGVSAQVSGVVPLSATAPRGTTAATQPSNPQVAK